MDDNMIVHGAIALHDEACRTIGEAMYPGWKPQAFNELPERERTYWLRSSRCFFEAIRDASDAMIWSGGTAMHDDEGSSEDVYHAYIDAALRDTPPEASRAVASPETSHE